MKAEVINLVVGSLQVEPEGKTIWTAQAPDEQGNFPQRIYAAPRVLVRGEVAEIQYTAYVKLLVAKGYLKIKRLIAG